jgi:hypothetical protein
MHSKQSDTPTYRSRATIYSMCAQQDIPPEAEAAFRYLEEMWLVIAEVADINERNRSLSLLGGGSHPLSPE